MLVRDLIERLQAMNMPTARVMAFDADSDDFAEVTGLVTDDIHNMIEFHADAEGQPCPKCDGKGAINGEDCADCHGGGEVKP
jgi:RecJ-like exonuclease